MSASDKTPVISKALKKKKINDIFMPVLITKSIYIPVINVGNNIEKVIKDVVSSEFEGKCIKEGFIKKDSIELVTYSSGLIKSSNIYFEVVIRCEVCSPVEGMIISCMAKNITKAGIRAEIPGDYSPLVIFVARDHNFKSEYFNSIQESDMIQVKVIGQRYELNDTYISIIGTLIESNRNK